MRGQIIKAAELQLSQSALLHNYRYYRSKLKPQTRLLVLLKANGYGHGAVEYAKQLEKAGADYLGVAFPCEGVELRKAGIRLPILILSSGIEDYPEIMDYSLEPCLPNIEAVIRFRGEVRASGRSSYPAHIKLDTGMHRLGFMESQLDELIDFLKASPEIEVKSIYSHLCADDEPQFDEFTKGQIELFEKMSTRLMEILPGKPLRHLLNTAGIERFTEYQYDMVRLGIGIYGVSNVNPDALRPVAHLRCPILQIKELDPSDGTVGYGRHGVIGPGRRRIATICIGYADGVNRHLGCGAASFFVNGHLAPTVGNICMDMCMIDITGIEAEVGDMVTVFGETPRVADLARILDTIPYEILVAVPPRVKKVIIE